MKQLMIVTAVMIGAAGPAAAQEEPTGSWADETSAYYFARGGSATDGTYLYLFGGYQLGVSASYPSYYRRARRYDPVANAWITLANLPIVESGTTYQYNAGAYYGGQLYSFGTSWQDGNGIVLTYSIANDAWSVLDGVTLPQNRFGAAAAVLGGRIYIAGGFTDAPSRRVDEFDPSDNSFTEVAELPVGLHLHSMVALPARGSLVVVGGESADGYEAGCHEYSPATDTWTTRTPITIDGGIRPRGSLAAFALRNRVYATGGRSDSGGSSAVFEYHPATDTWAPRASMASARYQHAAVAIAGRGYVYGGLPGYDEGEEFTPPDFGPAPELESPVTQAGLQPEASLQAQADPAARDGWVGRMIEFSAVISDPDPYDQVRLRIRYRRPLEPMWHEVGSAWSPQGRVTFLLSLPSNHPYDWEYRIEDFEENSFPAELESWLPAFDNSTSPDFRCDSTPPTDPVAQYPSEFDVVVGDPEAGDVVFGWAGATDNGPVSGLTHELEIFRGVDPFEVEATRSVPAGTGTATIRLPVGEGIRYWRVRARDIAGNVTPWSAPARFRVVYNDGIDHAAGDAGAACFFGAGPGGPPAMAALLAMAIAAGSLLNRRPRGRFIDYGPRSGPDAHGNGRVPQITGLAPGPR